MLITCPEGITPGMLIQVAGASTEVPTVAGVPVGAASPAGVAAGVAVGSPPPNMVMMGDASHMMPEVSYVEVDEISPAGWLCLIVGWCAQTAHWGRKRRLRRRPRDATLWSALAIRAMRQRCPPDCVAFPSLPLFGSFACPGLNLLGLCMRERRLVPVTQLAYAY